MYDRWVSRIDWSAALKRPSGLLELLLVLPAPPVTYAKTGVRVPLKNPWFVHDTYCDACQSYLPPSSPGSGHLVRFAAETSGCRRPS
ncbi:hypothetical protein F5144DRAFT_271561 [Chaetomium tenue]|uniref:Uncharacterized protein n=1 Tax=Chaetomium tenue TaxID=1854479 RepID=A0ACB7P063_9PEZI|nr:hypothetical protein F5144DRAFT_271561 [Chaetomium globosum]